MKCYCDYNLCLRNKWVNMSLQIYVEIERARLTRMLAKIKEDGGDISGTYYFKTQYNYFYSFPQGFIKACDCTLMQLTEC